MPHPARRPAARNHPPPLRSRADAVRLLDVAVARPLRAETLCIPLDRHGRGRAITIVTDTRDPDALLGVVEFMSCTAGDGPADHLVVASVRPGGGLLADDVDRWLEASAIAHGHGVLLVEWFVVAPSGLTTPRDLLGEPERWGQ